jgi:hypothetical protein
MNQCFIRDNLHSNDRFDLGNIVGTVRSLAAIDVANSMQLVVVCCSFCRKGTR